MKNLIHGIVFNKDELEDILCDGILPNDIRTWGILTSGDYVVHCLYDEDNKVMIYHNDNTHCSIESDIEAFQCGLQYAGSDVKITKVIICIEGNYSSYDTAIVMKAIENQSFSIVDYMIREGR